MVCFLVAAGKGAGSLSVTDPPQCLHYTTMAYLVNFLIFPAKDPVKHYKGMVVDMTFDYGMRTKIALAQTKFSIRNCSLQLLSYRRVVYYWLERPPCSW